MSFGKSKAKLLGLAEQGHLRGRRRHRGRGKDEVEEIIAFLKDPKSSSKPRRSHPQGRADDGPAGHRQDAARAPSPAKAGVPFFRHLGLRLRRDVRRRRREPRPRPLRAGQERAPASSSSTDRRRRPSPRRRPRRRSRRARADAEPAARRDGRLRVERRRHPIAGHEPPRRLDPACSAPVASTAASRSTAPTCVAAKILPHPHHRTPRPTTSTWRRSRCGTRAFRRRRPREPRQRGGALRRPSGQGRGRARRTSSSPRTKS